ncbi:hypothetical protein AHAS_Ahas06G0162700 [Arachis hypogaea]
MLIGDAESDLMIVVGVAVSDSLDLFDISLSENIGDTKGKLRERTFGRKTARSGGGSGSEQRRVAFTDDGAVVGGAEQPLSGEVKHIVDVAYQFGLLIDRHEATVQIYARGYIMMLLSTALFTDNSGARVHLRWLPYVADFDGLGKYSWGSVTLSWLYRCLCRVANRNFIWMPYNDLEVIQVVHPDILRPDHIVLWKLTTALIYFASIEWHQVDRVLSQLGGV